MVWGGNCSCCSYLVQAVEEYVAASASRSDMDRTSVGKGKKKTGTETGAVAVHPLSGEKVRQR